jgi:hypothetical protein
MTRRNVLIAAAIIVAIGLWWLFRPERLWVNQTVNEDFPVAGAASVEPASGASVEAPASGTTEEGSPRIVATGQFHGVAHETRGTATVYTLPDGQRVLRFTDFQTSNGPDVRVYLVAANDATDNDTVQRAGFVELGPIKGNQGDQNYPVPADLDLSRYRAVTIWCHRFNVNFGTAPLAAEGA